MTKPQRLLTKTAFGYGLNCDRLLWIYQNARDQLPEVDEAAQAIFNQGHRIGNQAKSLYLDGIEVDWSSGHEAGIAQTRTLIDERKPICEADFEYGSPADLRPQICWQHFIPIKLTPLQFMSAK
jgi:hypothetical protein